MAEKKIEVRVAEALHNDVGRGIVRLDKNAMEALEASSGDIVEIEGKKSTAAKPVYTGTSLRYELPPPSFILGLAWPTLK